jgi:hypothetical protein
MRGSMLHLHHSGLVDGHLELVVREGEAEPQREVPIEQIKYWHYDTAIMTGAGAISAESENR